MLVMEDSVAKWMGQALVTPQYYFVTLSALSVLLGGCLKTIRAAIKVSEGRDMSPFLATLILIPTCYLMSCFSLVLIWFGVNLILSFPGFVFDSG